MNGAFWAGRRPGWVAGGLAVTVGGLTVWLLRASATGVNVATVLALPVSAASLAVAAWGLVPSPPLSVLARELAGQVAMERGRARRQALGMSGDARPANLRFRSPVAWDEPELVQWRADGGPGRGTLKDVAGFYQSLDRGRMVILGEPGAGKTVLATQLVIDLIEALPGGALQPGTRPPVPVWLSLTSADLGEADVLARASSEELSTRLDQWMAEQLSVSYQVSRTAAGKLVRERWVLPVLDGLDEMDALGAGGTSGPLQPRAMAVVRALNAGTGRRPVVLVCRRCEYGQLALSPGSAVEDPVLQDATQIVLQPLELPAICDYLTRRFPGDQPRRIASRWEGVLAVLRSTALARGDVLAVVLSSPWRLFLAATAYEDAGTDPAELARMSATDVPEHLLAQLIPAVTRYVPAPSGGHYPPGRVGIWLTTLAVHLDQTSGDPGRKWSSTDLHLQRLWPIAGRKAVQRITALAVFAILGIALAVPGLLWVHAHGQWYPDSVSSWIGLTGAVIGSAYVGCRSVIDTDPSLHRLSLNIGSTVSRRQLAAGPAVLILGLEGALTGGLAAGLAGGPALGVAGALAVGLAASVAVGLAGNLAVSAEPTTVRRQNVTYGVVVALAGALAVALAAALTVGLATRLAFGLAFGLAGGLTFGLMFGQAVWLRYLIGCRLARRKGKLPPRVGQFLDWAYQAGLLRMSGTAIQFRHRELQVWLSSPLR